MLHRTYLTVIPESGMHRISRSSGLKADHDGHASGHEDKWADASEEEEAGLGSAAADGYTPLPDASSPLITCTADREEPTYTQRARTAQPTLSSVFCWVILGCFVFCCWEVHYLLYCTDHSL